MSEINECPLCQRKVKLTAHHLIPRKLHRRKHFKRHYSKRTLAATLLICRACHNGLHKLYDEMHLAKHLYNLELIRADPRLARHFNWVAKRRVSIGS